VAAAGVAWNADGVEPLQAASEASETIATIARVVLAAAVLPTFE